MDGDTRGLGARAEHRPAHLTRRLLVLGGAGAALAVLVEQGLRIDTPPPPPPVPTRRRAPDETVLLAALADVERIDRAQAAVLSARDDALVRRLRTLGQQQARVLRGRLTNAGVPTSVIDTAVASASSHEAVDSRGALGELLLESLAPRAWQSLSSAGPDTRELLAAAYAQRVAAAILLGSTLAAPAASSVRPDLVARTEALTYAFEVIAAQSTGAQRRAAQTTLTGLARLQDALPSAGSTLPAGWALPYPVTTPREARRLATDTLSEAVDAAAALTRSEGTATSLEESMHWSGHIQSFGLDWGLPLTAFPGASS